ncbi:dephospho-CoA kinase [Pontibacillus chungwhensis BH030062]|uniref:Dephospho-CoA kinase n=2 Tax=Pontibacillus TaxID=289201 RepID=A0A0A2URG8_9BACI|nr:MULTISPECIES: dephospho-CoA kinase [Pontibacillus]KGP90847.1 dephospho-CoA kinase [Pontibacillus chungwhensis BH030062]GGD16682.1 dephospho-CoA kinase [Pontibacillus salipaludis]
MGVVIGLTGSIATGKSTVSLMFDDYGIPVVDADKLSREVVKPGRDAYNQIVSVFGEGILREDHTLDRKALGEIVFNNDEKRKQLNEIVHPAVRSEMVRERDQYLMQGDKAVVLDIPLLFESQLTDYVDKTLVVAVDEEVQLKRLMERDGSTKEEALSRIRSQISITEKSRMADEVIDNNGSKKETYDQLDAILRKWEILP